MAIEAKVEWLLQEPELLANKRQSSGSNVSKAAALAAGAPDLRRHERMGKAGTLVQLFVDSTTTTLQLNDPEHFNTFSTGLGEDMRRAVQHVRTLQALRSMILQGAGPHFSVGELHK